MPRRALAAEPLPIEFPLEASEFQTPAGNRGGLLFGYNGQVPGPILETRAGDTVRIRFRNSLPEDTNLHFHGLHVPPTGNADNALLMVPAGESFDYEWTLPADHPAGLNWIHPHMHGTTARQVARGLAMPLIVRGPLDEEPAIQSATEHMLVLQDFDLNAAGLPLEPGMMERNLGREGPLVTVNGRLRPALSIRPGGWARLRLINASPSRFYRLSVEEHTLLQVATDGGSLAAPREVDELLLLPGERADLMVRGSRPGGSYALRNLPYDRGGGMGMFPSAGLPFTLATLDYEGDAVEAPALSERLASIDPLPEPARSRTFVLGGGMGGMMGGGMAFTINGRTFNPNRVDTRVRLGDVEEWTFINAMAMDHPMHIHTNPFQVIGRGGEPEAAWRDIVLVPRNGSARIRTQFRDYAGKLVYHCHILDHEDLGMMGILEIV